jgi:cysteinyl-tRNA synthetase
MTTLKAGMKLLGFLEAGMGDWTNAPDLNPYAHRLAEVRTNAMATRDFSQVDALKSALTAAGVEVRMSKDGVELIPGPGFDPSKLEGLL